LHNERVREEERALRRRLRMRDQVAAAPPSVPPPRVEPREAVSVVAPVACSAVPRLVIAGSSVFGASLVGPAAALSVLKADEAKLEAKREEETADAVRGVAGSRSRSPQRKLVFRRRSTEPK
jgi:hypothetical protein